MDYEQKWERLREWMEEAIEEGVQRGFNESGLKFEDGAFFAYKFVLDRMNEMDGEKNESN